MLLRKFFPKFALLLYLAGIVVGCGGDDDDEGEGSFPDEVTKQVLVFDIPVVATQGVTNDQLLHVASIMAEYLDSDEDGTANDSSVTDYMASNSAIMAVFKDEVEIEAQDFASYPGKGDGVVTVIATEIIQATPSTENGFDPTLEEVLHLITSNGYAKVYPDKLAEAEGSDIAVAMDTARGGKFADIPSEYPEDAWYTYDDDSCDYKCQVTEYAYWGITSYLGAHDYAGRLDEIQQEWRLNTADKIEGTDAALFKILTDNSLKLPTELPDGTYDGGALKVEEI